VNQKKEERRGFKRCISLSKKKMEIKSIPIARVSGIKKNHFQGEGLEWKEKEKREPTYSFS